MKHPLPFAALLCLLCSSLVLPGAEKASKLPWEKNYAAALAKAKAEKRPVFLMLTAEWCGPCKMLERDTLPAPSILAGLKEFVWVQAFENETLNKRFGLSGYPTLVFLNSADEKVVAKTSGAEPANSFLSHVVEARQGAGLPLTEEMKAMVAAKFEPDAKLMREMLEKGDLAGLKRHLEPAKRDKLRQWNYALLKVNLPKGVAPEDVVVMGRDHEELKLSKGGLASTMLDLEDEKLPLRIFAPGCNGVSAVAALPKGEAVASVEVGLKRLGKNDAAKFTGRVLRPDGKPVANAIVRVCDWDSTRTDADGRFSMAGICGGKFLVRAEAPGGEFHRELDFKPGAELKQDLTLVPVTTVGIRWALQRREGLRNLAGEGVRTGEAHFSAAHSRFVLERGAESRQYWGSDFMLNAWDSKSLRPHTKAEYAEAADKAAPGTPVFWLFDSCARATGLHLESLPFAQILEVPKEAGSGRYFEFLRGKPVKKGDVFTLWCVQKDCYAKMEIIDLTVVEDKPRAAN